MANERTVGYGGITPRLTEPEVETYRLKLTAYDLLIGMYGDGEPFSRELDVSEATPEEIELYKSDPDNI